MKSFSEGIVGGVGASLTVLREWKAFLQIAGPWTILSAAVVAAYGAAGQQTGPTKSILLLIAALLILLTLIFGFPTVAVAWVRWLLQRRLPRHFVALPDRSTLTVIRKLWLFFAAAAFLEATLAKGTGEVATTLGLPASAMSAVTAAVADLIVIVAASDRAFQATAIIAEAGEQTSDKLLVISRDLWPALPVGLVASLVPFYLLRQALSFLFDRTNLADRHAISDTPVLSFVVFGIFLGLAGVASASTFLCRAYAATIKPTDR